MLSLKPFLQQLRDANSLRAPEFNTESWSIGERGNELAGETGELCNVLKKILRCQTAGKPIPNDLLRHAAEELGDVVICADLVACQLNLDLENAVRYKFNLTSRKVGSRVML